MPTFSEEKFEGHEYRVDVRSDGSWSAAVSTMDGQTFSAKTLQELTTKVRAAIRRANAKLGIKATIVGIRADPYSRNWDSRDDPKTWPTGTRDVTIRGWDERRRCILYEADGEKTAGRNAGGSRSGSGTLSAIGLMSYDVEGMFTRRLSNDEVKRFTELVMARESADRDLIKFLEDVRIANVEEFVEAEVQRLAEAPAAEPIEDPRALPTKRAKRRS